MLVNTFLFRKGNHKKLANALLYFNLNLIACKIEVQGRQGPRNDLKSQSTTSVFLVLVDFFKFKGAFETVN